MVLIEPYVPSLIVENPQNRVEILSFLLRKPSVALAAQKFINKSLNPALKFLEQGNEEKAVEAFLNGVQGKPTAISQITDPVKSMMLDNTETIKELTTKLLHFTKKKPQSPSQHCWSVDRTHPKHCMQLRKRFQKTSREFRLPKFLIRRIFRILKNQRRRTHQL